MSVYEHQQGTYRSYRVARSVDGHLKQAYFPRTDQGFASANKLDDEWAAEQEEAKTRLNRLSQNRVNNRMQPISAKNRVRTADQEKLAFLIKLIKESNTTSRAHLA